MHICFPYGTGVVETNFESGNCLGVLEVAPAPALADPAGQLREALERPIGFTAPLLEPVKTGHRVLIVVSDSFRQTCVDRLLPTLIDALAERGVRDSDISFLVATGTHRGPTDEELREILGNEVHARFATQVDSHNPHDASSMAFVGTTSRGTRVMVNRAALDADHLILTGATVLHYFGGFGGGRKAILPGICGAETIAQNHWLNLDAENGVLDPNVRIGRLDGNPVAEDMLEAARMVPTAGIINTVLNRDEAIGGVFVGEMDAAHRAAAAFALRLFGVPIAKKADLVIAAAGPRKNYVQSHKALFNAYQAMRPGGRIVLAARCEEGLGGEQFKKWIRMGSRQAIVSALRRAGEINGQTALSTVEKAPSAWFVTDLTPEDTATLGARKAETLTEALERARAELAAEGTPDPEYYLMPSAAYTVPFLGALPTHI